MEMSLVVPKYDAAYSLLLVNGEDALLWSMLTCLLDLDDHLLFFSMVGGGGRVEEVLGTQNSSRHFCPTNVPKRMKCLFRG
jgi:hypothetical protein